jgi:hypothetical protein
MAALGCYPGVTDVSTFDSVTTLRDTTAQFATATTFALADSVVHLAGEDEDQISRDHDALILQTIRTNMTNAGYTEVATPQSADLNVVVMVTSSTYLAYYWDYWCSYYGWWYPSWGCYYPTYWYGYQYTLGTILIGMSDNRQYDPDLERAPLIWFAGANGLAGQGATAQRIQRGIDQAFTQSPYIGRP